MTGQPGAACLNVPTSICDLHPYKTLHVQKDILAYAIGETSYATMSFVDQTYSQTSVPEPGTLGLLGIGLLGFVGYGWWRRR